MDIPYIRKLFSRENATSSKAELIIFITPHIISTSEDPEIATQELRKHLKNKNSKSEKEVLSVFIPCLVTSA